VDAPLSVPLTIPQTVPVDRAADGACPGRFVASWRPGDHGALLVRRDRVGNDAGRRHRTVGAAGAAAGAEKVHHAVVSYAVPSQMSDPPGVARVPRPLQNRRLLVAGDKVGG